MTTLCKLAVITPLLLMDCNLVGVVDQPQTWALTNNIGEVAIVSVSPFTHSGTFGETADSDGWWVSTGGCPPYRLTVGGNITHTGRGDHWTFVSFGGAGCMRQSLGRGEGYANGSFPAANEVDNGTLWMRTQGRGGTITGNGTWRGRRLN